jgi:hypothetical protein
MKTKPQKRSSYLTTKWLPLHKRTPTFIYGYSKSKKFVCRLAINAAGVAVYTGKTGKTLVDDLSWERLVKKLKKP